MIAKQSHPNVPLIAVINPNSGPGSALDPGYVSGIVQEGVGYRHKTAVIKLRVVTLQIG